MYHEADVIATHLVSDALIAVAYFSIPVGLLYFVRKRKDLDFNWMLVLFALFIVLCGTTHIFSILAIWQPLYRLEGIVKLLTGIASIATAILLWRLIPAALSLPSLKEITRRRDELEVLVEERTAELRQVNDALRSADARKDEFLAMLSHELRNPLASISNAIQLMSMPAATAEHTSWSKDIIVRQSKHMTRLIDDLLDVSRITRGKIELKKIRLDASAVVTGVVDAVRPQIIQKKQTLNVSITPGGLWCDADPTRLEQILTNLLVNATRYTPESGSIRLKAAREGDRIVFRIVDSGVGIPQEKLSEIFELFAQGDRTLARSEGGLGIGLTVVKRITEMHGGSVRAASEGAGHGSEFIVTLPAAAPMEALAEPSVTHAAEPGVRRILIVDDNVDTASGLAQLLKLSGHSTRIAHDGPAAILEAHAFEPDIILLDIGLPGMDGYEAVKRLRKEGFQNTSIIALTGYGQEEDRRRSGEAGFDFHLVKPVDFDILTTLINTIRER